MSVALIDDDEAVLQSLQLVLKKRGLSVECFSSAEAFLQVVGSQRFSAVVSDVRMPGLTGLDLQAEMKARRFYVPLILITGHGDINMAVRAIKEGAFDFVEKPFDHERLFASIVAAGERGEKLQLEDQERAALEAKIAELSPRQRQVMDLVVEGLANKEIAMRLNISPRTVENYRAWVMEKTGAKNLAELVRLVMLVNKPT